MAISFSAGYDPTQPISWKDRATQGFKPRFRQPIPLNSPFSSVGADESYVGKEKVQPWELGKEDISRKDETFTSGFSEPSTRVTATPSGSGFFSPDGKSPDPITFARDFAVKGAPSALSKQVSDAANKHFIQPFGDASPFSGTRNTIDRAVSDDPTRTTRTVETGKIERPKRPVHTPNRATQGIAPRPTVPSERATQGFGSRALNAATGAVGSAYNVLNRGLNEGINQERAVVEGAKASQGLGSRLVRNFSPGSKYLNVGYNPGATNIATKAGNISEDAANFVQLFGDDLSQVGKTAGGAGKWYPRNLQELGEMNPFQKGGAKGGVFWSFGKGSSTGPTPLTRQVVKRTATSPVGRAISNVASTSAAKGAGKFLGKAVPVAGTSLAVWDAQNRFREGDIVGGTLSGIGAIPGFGIPALGAQVVYDAFDGKGRLTRLGENIGDRVGDFLTRGTRADTARILAEIEAMRTPEQIANTRDQYVDKMGNVKKGVTKDESGQATGFDTGVPQTYWEGGRQFAIQPEVYNPQGELQAPEGRTEITDPWSMENLQRKGLLDDGTLIAGGQTLYGDTDYGLQEDGTLGTGDDDWGSDIDINELENLGLGIELAKADTGKGTAEQGFLDNYIKNPEGDTNTTGDLSQAELREKYGDPYDHHYSGYFTDIKYDTDEDGRLYYEKPDLEWTQQGGINYKDWYKVYKDEEKQSTTGTAEQGFLDDYIKNPEGYDSNLDQRWKDYEEASEDEHAKMAKMRIEAGYDPGWRRGDEIWVNPEQARKDWEEEGAPTWGEVFEKGQPKVMDWPDDGYHDSLEWDKYTAEDFKDDKPTQSTDLPSLDQLQSGEGYIKNVDTGEVTKIGGSKPGGVNTSSTTNLNPKSEPYQMYSEQELDDMDWIERKYKGDPQYQAAQRDYDRAMDDYMAADSAWKAYDQTYLTGGGNSRVGRDDDVEIANSRVAEVDRLFDISTQKMQEMQAANTRLNNIRNTLLWGNPDGP